MAKLTPRLCVALATYEKAPQLTPDDRVLIPALDRAGVDAVAAVWSRDREWTLFDAVVIRSCWDYHRRAGEFLSWIERLEANRIPTWNSPRLIRWNADKRYLLDLARTGIATVPTAVLARATVDDVVATCAANGWNRFVVKPAVSASGYETHALTVPLDDAARALVSGALAVGDVLVQPFVEEVEREGEYSFIFIDGALSHTAIKRAAAGEFRVQTEYGGSVTVASPTDGLAAQALQALGAIPETTLYARVDGVARAGEFLLTELELIEPNLFLSHEPAAADRLAAAIARRLTSAR
jgi:glutathione synthase/RimK-type ligase-like ATP-grasp enzyme